MIISVAEVHEIKAIIAEVKEELKNEGIPFKDDVELGVMIETPASVMISRELAKEVDFFRRGKVKVLVNVDIFSEGFDCPDVEFVQLARPTLSLAKYLQQVGRQIRIDSSSRS